MQAVLDFSLATAAVCERFQLEFSLYIMTLLGLSARSGYLLVHSTSAFDVLSSQAFRRIILRYIKGVTIVSCFTQYKPMDFVKGAAFSGF